MEKYKKGEYYYELVESIKNLEDPALLVWPKVNEVPENNINFWSNQIWEIKKSFKQQVIETIFEDDKSSIKSFKVLWARSRVHEIDYLWLDVILKVLMESVDPNLEMIDYFKYPEITDINYTLAKCLAEKGYPLITTNISSGVKIAFSQIKTQKKVREVFLDKDFENYIWDIQWNKYFDYQDCKDDPIIFKLCWSFDDKTSVKNYINSLNNLDFSSIKQEFLNVSLMQRDLLILWYQSFSEKLLASILMDRKSDRKIVWINDFYKDDSLETYPWKIDLSKIREIESWGLVPYLTDSWLRDENKISLFNIDKSQLSNIIDDAWDLPKTQFKTIYNFKKVIYEKLSISWKNENIKRQQYFSKISNLNTHQKKNISDKIYETLDYISLSKIIDDKPTLQDRLWRLSMIESVTEYIINSKSSSVLSLSGDWWVWKTSILKMVEEKINTKNYWVHHIVWLDAMQQKFWKDENPLFPILTNLYNSLNENSLFQEELKILKQYIISVSYFINLKSFNFWRFREQLKKEQEEDFTRWSELYLLKQKLETLIKSITNKLKSSGQNSKIIFFIDNLDYLEWEKSLEFLEMLKIYFDIENCVFVLGINERRVEEIAMNKYWDEDGKNFLLKIISNSFHLNILSKPKLKSYIYSLLAKSNIELTNYAEVIANLLEWNPRKIIRFVNSFVMTHQIAKSIDNYNPKILIYILIIQKEDAELFRSISKNTKELSNIIGIIEKKNSSQYLSKKQKSIYWKYISKNEFVKKSILGLIECNKHRNIFINIDDYIYLTGNDDLTRDIVLKDIRSAILIQNDAENFMVNQKYENAIESYKAACEIYKRLNKYRNQAICLYFIWKCNWELSDLSWLEDKKIIEYRNNAIEAYKESLYIDKEHDYKLGILVSLIKIWRSYLLNKEYNEAEKCFSESLTMSENRNDTRRKIKSLTWLWLSCLNLSKFDESEKFLKQAYHLLIKNFPKSKNNSEEESYKIIVLESLIKLWIISKKHEIIGYTLSLNKLKSEYGNKCIEKLMDLWFRNKDYEIIKCVLNFRKINNIYKDKCIEKLMDLWFKDKDYEVINYVLWLDELKDEYRYKCNALLSLLKK